MVEPKPRLVALPLSPWSERARWALDHHRLDYELVLHVPFLGERRLRRLVAAKKRVVAMERVAPGSELGAPKKRATVPVLVLPGSVLTESWDIVQHADRHGHSTPLLPSDRLPEIRRYTELADRTMEVGRALVMRAVLASGEALDETLPPAVPDALRPWIRPVTRFGARWFARKYDLRLDAEAEQTGAVRAALSALRAALAGSSHVLGSFTYADIVMAGLLQSVAPVAQPHIPLGPATRRVWTSPVLAAEFADLVAWRDQLYERHRRAAPPARLDATAGPSAEAGGFAR
jgi:glutathione S-transferase